MIRPDKTVLALATISDPGLFEALATVVLREALPERYGNLTHPGVNHEGKTVRAPVDGLAFVPGANPRHMVVVHHTTCKKSDLLRKWLHAPSPVTSRRGNRKSSAPLGDLLKTAAIATAERQSSPSLRVTLALTTNREPPEDVTREIEREAHAREIELDVWACSRIAQFLDQNPAGQRIRKRYLGIDEEYLSRDLLHELSRASLEAHRPRVSDDEQIDRVDARSAIEGAASPVGFLVGASGYGKSVACHRYLSSHVERGGCGLVLPHEVLLLSLTLDQALDSALRQLHPALAQGSGAETRLLCSTESPLLIVVEDVSRSGHSAHLIEKLLRWAYRQPRSRDVPDDNWRLVCPIWPELFASLSHETRKQAEPLAMRLGAFAPEDARLSILQRSRCAGAKMSELEADHIAAKLGYDPLLIGLSDFKKVVHPRQVLAEFIAGSVDRLAATGGTRTAYDYVLALRGLAGHMLTMRSMDPAWNDLVSWFGTLPEQIITLRELVKHGEILRLTQLGDGARLSFRHDRVRKWLLVDAIACALKENNLDTAVLAEPFFADVVGEAIADPQAPPAIADLAQRLNPLALFYALHSFGEPSAPVHHAVLSAIENWLADGNSHSRGCQSLRFNALHVLSNTQSSRIVMLLGRFRDRTWTAPLAGLRNGDLRSGIDLCRSLEPGSGAGWRDRAVEHAMDRFGPALVSELSDFLRRSDLTNGEISGALRFAGHMGSVLLADAVQACWDADSGRVLRLDDYLWAMAQCGGTRTDELLASACEEWALLSDVSEREGHPSPRDELAAHEVAWAFWKRLPEPALRFFIRRAERDDLRWPITYMLHGVDHPDALSFIAGELAKTSRVLEGTEGFSPFAHTVSDHWQRRDRERDRPMSEASRARLRDAWTCVQCDRHVRKQSFRLWAATSRPEDLTVLRLFEVTDELADDILRARLQRKDELAVPLLVDRIRQDQGQYWWLQSARDISSDSMITLIDERLLQRGDTLLTPNWGDRGDQDWIFSELLIRLAPAPAETLLLRHWSHVRFSARYVQAALYTARPRLLELVAQVVSECPSPTSLFEHIHQHFGIRYLGHPGVTRVEQMEALTPYFGHMDDHALHSFWDVCNERGWIEFRRRHLDPRLTGEWRAHAGIDDGALHDELNHQLAKDGNVWLDLWVGRLMETGRSSQNILGIVREWLILNRSPRALEIAASIVVLIGGRSDLDLLNDGNDKSELALDILEDTRFAVYRRILS